ncbi:hypothetical protein [Bradyrhizobium sp. JYMT SZCCT0428]|uniref:hypothetical protein n=1 Tax=Bradyrhizobium sp. JYMT SZCCT0428 TaxID=2807673 RepID=UPI001BAB35A6|nr:hypothetical protein [Bradyrhizobium sp. JYMT SZCCT0428]MBR1150129.1 hypothetical protein [Bradyrhizobium sp. JYMT SZCCT0428]
MGTVVRLPVRHARASSVLSAKRANKSEVKLDALARSVSKTRRHQSDGILFRCHHFRTLDDPPQSTSAAMTSLEGQRSMTSLNEVMVGESLSMPGLLGRHVPICKGIMGRDLKSPVGHSGPMGKDDGKLAESAWQMAFQERLSRIQGKRTHEAMAEYLEMPVESWKKCVNRGDTFPIRKLPRLALLAGIPVESLIKGDRDDELAAPVERYRKRASKPAARRAG